MAKVALTVAGGIIGSAVGMPGLGMMLGGALGGYIERRGADPIRQEGPRLDDLHVQVSSYGSPIFRLWGTMRVAGNIIWSGPKVESYSDETTGGGKNSPEVVTTSYHYHQSFAIAICVGPIDKLLQIWADGKLIYSIVPTNNSITRIRGLNFTLYEGNETQTADVTIEADIGAGDVPGFRGLCYIVFDTFPLALFGNRMPNFSFDITTNASKVDVPYTLLNDFIDPAEWAEDRIVFFPDGVNFIVEQLGTWAKFNTTNNALIKSADYSIAASTIPAIFGSAPHRTVSFDIDENNIIHTFRGSNALGHKLCRLDGITFSLIEEASSYMPELILFCRVFRNPDYPFVISMSATTIYVSSRDGYIGTSILDQTSPPRYPLSFTIDDDSGRIFICDWKDSSPNLGQTLYVFQLDAAGHITFLSYADFDSSMPTDICFDSTSNQIIIGSSGGSTIDFFDADDIPGGSTATISVTLYPHNRNNSAFRQGVQNGYLYIPTTVGGNIINRINVSAQVGDRSWELEDSDYVFNGGSVYDPLTHSMIVGVDIDGAPRIIKMNLDRSDSTRVLLSNIVKDICEISGLDPTTELDTTALTTLVHGFVVNENMRARAALQVLMEAFFFTAVESDGVLKFVNKGGSVVDAIPEADLAAHIVNAERPQQLITMWQEELSLPAELNFMYLDSLTNYQINVQRAQRQNTASKEILTVRMPIALEPNDAKQICAKLFSSTWTERVSHTITVSKKYMHLDPGDVITITEGGVTHTVRIETIQYGAGVITMELVNEDAGSFLSIEEGFELPPPDDIIIEYPGPSLLVVIDIPVFPRSIIPGVLLAVQGYSEDWEGAQILRSPPQGTV